MSLSARDSGLTKLCHVPTMCPGARYCPVLSLFPIRPACRTARGSQKEMASESGDTILSLPLLLISTQCLPWAASAGVGHRGNRITHLSCISSVRFLNNGQWKSYYCSHLPGKEAVQEEQSGYLAQGHGAGTCQPPYAPHPRVPPRDVDRTLTWHSGPS